MSKELELSNRLSLFFALVDDRRWDDLSSLFSAEVELDYESYGAGPAVSLSAGDIIGNWRLQMAQFDHTHHQIGNIQISIAGADSAIAKAYGTATHVKGDAVSTVLGSYDMLWEMSGEGWRLTALRFNFRCETEARLAS